MDNEPVIPTELSPEPLPRKKGKWSLGVLIAFVLFVALILGFRFMASAPSDFPTNDPIYTIVEGETVKEVGTDLAAAHFIRSRFLFATLISIYGGEYHMPAGDYYFPHPVNVFAVAHQIASGNHNLSPVKVTVPEGDTILDIEETLKEKLPAVSTEAFNEAAKGSEGYLFPETYFFFPKVTAVQVVTQMKNMFEEKAGTLFNEKNVPKGDRARIVILASLVEREAHGDDDRDGIASVLVKRLSIGMPLQVDASVAYAASKGERALVKADFRIDSPYNTYKYKGLPPGPIANPGLEALAAAINPAPTEYLYYLHDKHGTIHYAKTYKEHLANIKKYL